MNENLQENFLSPQDRTTGAEISALLREEKTEGIYEQMAARSINWFGHYLRRIVEDPGYKTSIAKLQKDQSPEIIKLFADWIKGLFQLLQGLNTVGKMVSSEPKRADNLNESDEERRARYFRALEKVGPFLAEYDSLDNFRNYQKITSPLEKMDLNTRQHLTDQFLHDLKNILSTLFSNFDAYEQGIYDLDEELRADFITDMVESLERLVDVVNEFSIDKDIADISLSLEEVHHFLNSKLKELKDKHRYMNIAVVFSPGFMEKMSLGELSIPLSQRFLSAMLRILLDNSGNFYAKEMRFEVSIEKDKLCLLVQDNGTGFPVQQLSDVQPITSGLSGRLYEIERGKTTRVDKGGTGIGLAEIASQTEEKGGRVLAGNSVDSEFTTFVKVELPLLSNHTAA